MKSIISLLLCSLLIGCATSQTAEIAQESIPTPQPETQPEQNVRPYGQAFQDVRPYGRAFRSTTDVICNNSKVMYNLLKSEPGPQVPIFFGLIRTPQGDVTKMAQIFIDKENRKFSIVESSVEGISCIISAGFDFDIMPHLHAGESQKINIQNNEKDKNSFILFNFPMPE